MVNAKHPYELSSKLAAPDDEVTAIRFDYAISFSMASDLELRIETELRITSAAGERTHWVHPENAGSVAELLLTCLHKPVQGLTFDQRGSLTLHVGNLVIEVPPDEQFEAWTLAGAAGLKVVCGPGGALSTWNEPPESAVSEKASG